MYIIFEENARCNTCTLCAYLYFSVHTVLAFYVHIYDPSTHLYSLYILVFLCTYMYSSVHTCMYIPVFLCTYLYFSVHTRISLYIFVFSVHICIPSTGLYSMSILVHLCTHLYSIYVLVISVDTCTLCICLCFCEHTSNLEYGCTYLYSSLHV